MRFVLATALKDWRRSRRDPAGLLMWIGIPLIIGTLISMVSGGSSGPGPQAHVLVADEDGTFLSGLLVRALGQDAAGGIVRAEPVDLETGQARIEEGDGSALLIIPRGFSSAALNEQPIALELLTNPSQIILPGIVEELLSAFVDAAFYLHRVIGDDIRTFAQGPPSGMSTFPDSSIAEFSIRINRLMDRLSGYLFPPLITVAATVGNPEETTDSRARLTIFFMAGILFMSLLFIAQGLSVDFWQERDQKTLRRVVVSPQRTLHFLLGKLLFAAGVIVVVCTIAMGIGYAVFPLDVSTMPLALLWAVLSGLMLTVLMIAIQVHAASQRAGSVLTMALIFPLMMAGGSFFPFEQMPSWMARFGRMTPNGWALEQLKQIAMGSAEASSLLAALVGLVTVSTVLFWLSARRLRRGFAQG